MIQNTLKFTFLNPIIGKQNKTFSQNSNFFRGISIGLVLLLQWRYPLDGNREPCYLSAATAKTKLTADRIFKC